MPPMGVLANAALRRLQERACDGLAATLTPAQVHRRIDERVVRARGEAERITGSNFAEVVGHG